MAITSGSLNGNKITFTGTSTDQLGNGNVPVQSGDSTVPNSGGILDLKNAIIVEVVGIGSIGKYAFAMSKIESIILPDSLTTIYDNAFASTFNLESIIIPDSVTRIDENAFINSRLKTVIINKTGLKNLNLKYGKDQQFFGIVVEIKPDGLQISLWLIIILVILSIIIIGGLGIIIGFK